MSEAQDKTEKPTAKRLADARREGQVARSNDLTSALVLGAIALILIIYGGYFFQYVSHLAREILGHELRKAQFMTLSSFETMLNYMIYQIIILLLPFLMGTMVIGIFANIIQIRLMFTTETLKPKLEKLNPLSGFKRFFSVKSLVELVKGVLKMVIIGFCAYSVINGEKGQLFAMGQMGFTQSWQVITQLAVNICSAVAIVLLILGLADWWYQHYELMKKLRMSRQEVKEEMKNAEGSPQVKNKIKAAGRAIAQKRMLKAVAVADVVVTNPTHLAIAIQYDPVVAPAPRVVAKGADHLAFKIREVAKENGVPIMENKPLARSIYALVEVDHMIPPELFIAVAEVLAYVFKRNKGRQKRRLKRIQDQGVMR